MFHVMKSITVDMEAMTGLLLSRARRRRSRRLKSAQHEDVQCSWHDQQPQKKERAQYDAYLEELRYQASMVLSSYGVGHLEGKNKGLEQGFELGNKDGRLKTAKKMLAKGYSHDEICELTKLTPEDLAGLL
jgi:flagellar biosynthesis/type III secretory pathway protein FliH